MCWRRNEKVKNINNLTPAQHFLIPFILLIYSNKEHYDVLTWKYIIWMQSDKSPRIKVFNKRFFKEITSMKLTTLVMMYVTKLQR